MAIIYSTQGVDVNTEYNQMLYEVDYINSN